jgi:hypothetical protein
MRLRLMATYLGVPYQAGLGPDGNQVTLFSPAPQPEELGFTAGPGHWRKQVSVTDLGALWQSRPVGDYRGEPCLVLDDLGDRLHIAYLGRDAARAAQLGYWEIDREVFEVVVARDHVTDLVEERVVFPLAAAMFPSSGPESPAGGQAAAATEVAGQAGHNGAAGNSSSAPARYGGGPGYADGGPGYADGGPGYADGGPGYADGGPGYADGGPGYADDAYGNGTGIAGNGIGAAGNGQVEGYGGADHASRMPDRVAAWHGSPAPEPWPEPWPGSPSGNEAEARAGSDPRAGLWPGRDPGGELLTEREPGSEPETTQVPARRSARKDRISPESVFAELLDLAAIPQAAYAVDEEVPGAMCLIEADGGFEVFSRTDDARLEVRFFEDEEAAYFYLFGVLAAEAIRSGRLAPPGPDRANGRGHGVGQPGTSAATEDVSKYLRDMKLPRSASRTGIVYLAGGADGPPLPKQPRRSPSQIRKGAPCVSQIGLFVFTSQTSLTSRQVC